MGTTEVGVGGAWLHGHGKPAMNEKLHSAGGYAYCLPDPLVNSPRIAVRELVLLQLVSQATFVRRAPIQLMPPYRKQRFSQRNLFAFDPAVW